ncbi:MAG TPA: hypothetical protein VD772_07445, partial [Anseongella sp.]|nr:hypothetical protein [Anseongella sp.]
MADKRAEMEFEDKIEKVKAPPEVDEDLPMHIKGWKVQRVCWYIISGLLLLIALGVFGEGPLSRVRDTSGGAIL